MRSMFVWAQLLCLVVGYFYGTTVQSLIDHIIWGVGKSAVDINNERSVIMLVALVLLVAVWLGVIAVGRRSVTR